MSESSKDLEDLARELLTRANISEIPHLIEPIHRGGNNQIFLVDCKNKKYILKKYYQHLEDKRDRLNNEFTFLQATQERALHQTPKTYAKTNSTTAALYEYVEGKSISDASEVTESLVTQAAQFIANINTRNIPILENTLAPASEACFSINEHIKNIDFRIQELIEVKPHHKHDPEFTRIIGKIIECWEVVKGSVIDCCRKELIDIDQELSLNERILSPSDFGFHNAIIRPNNIVTFIDFEYAGWDDPAKLVGDFFAQVAIKIDPKYLNLFIKTAFGNFKNFEVIHKRSNLLLNAYKIKWCCIVLNIFLPKHLARRKFSNPNLNIIKLKNIQLYKAWQLLKEIPK